MPYGYRVIVACVLLSSGCCSVIIMDSGKDLSALTTSEQVHHEFGKPCAVGVSEGQPYEEYLTHQKIAETLRGATSGEVIAMTWGLLEFLSLPAELTLWASRTISGQHLRFVFDESGKVVRVFLDGNPLGFMPKPPAVGLK